LAPISSKQEKESSGPRGFPDISKEERGSTWGCGGKRGSVFEGHRPIGGDDRTRLKGAEKAKPARDTGKEGEK